MTTTQTESECDIEPVAGEPSRRSVPKKFRDALPLLILILAIIAVVLTSVQFLVHRGEVRTLESARESVAGVASDAAVAVLSYRAETVDQDLESASTRLTGDFLDSFTSLADQIIAPTARDKKITMQATSVGSAIASVTSQRAEVLVYVNQIVTMADNPTPSQSASAVRVGMVDIDGAWLVDSFTPLL